MEQQTSSQCAMQSNSGRVTDKNVIIDIEPVADVSNKAEVPSEAIVTGTNKNANATGSEVIIAPTVVTDTATNSSVGQATSDTINTTIYKGNNNGRSFTGARGLWIGTTHAQTNSRMNSLRNHIKPDSECQKNNAQLQTDISQVQQMEQSLIKLMDDFHAGRLRAFGRDITFEQMERVRERQERLARLHFDLNAKQEVFGYDSDEGKRVGRETVSQLMDSRAITDSHFRS